jgi:hypothetical protein
MDRMDFVSNCNYLMYVIEKQADKQGYDIDNDEWYKYITSLIIGIENEEEAYNPSMIFMIATELGKLLERTKIG